MIEIEEKLRQLTDIAKEDELCLVLTTDEQDLLTDIQIKLSDGKKLDVQDQMTISTIFQKI